MIQRGHFPPTMPFKEELLPGGRDPISSQCLASDDLPLTWPVSGIGAEIATDIALRLCQQVSSAPASSLGQYCSSAATRHRETFVQAGPAISPCQAVSPGPSHSKLCPCKVRNALDCWYLQTCLFLMVILPPTPVRLQVHIFFKNWNLTS